MNRLLCLVLTLACAHTAQPLDISAQLESVSCVTQCGLRFAPAKDCAGLQRLETRTLRAFERHVAGWTYERTCAALEGWRVFVHPFDWEEIGACPTGWPVEGIGCLAGYTHPHTGEIEIRKADWNDEVLPHEIVHVFQVEFREPAGHCDWAKRGIIQAIESVTGRKHKQDDQPCGDILTAPRLR